MGVTPWYCTREQVKAAIDSVETARNNARIDRACASATEAIYGLCRRTFYPWIGTRYFEWPDAINPTDYRVWTDDLLAVTSLTAAGVTISASDYFLYPADAAMLKAPYRWVELDRASSTSWNSGDTSQRNIAITGTWGYTQETELAGTTTEALDDSETGVDVTNSAAIGVGDAILIDTEYMVVTGKSLITTGQTLQTPMTASAANTSCAVTDGTAYSVDEVITLDSERMVIEDVSGNTLVVRRAADGTVVAAHNGSTVYAPRTLTVVRGALGSTRATHLIAATVLRHVPPFLVSTLALGEAENVLLSEESGWARTPSEGVSARPASGVGLAALRERVEESYGLRTQHRAV